MEKLIKNINSEPIGEDTVKNYYEYMADAINKQEGNLHLEDGYKCKKCKNRGYIAKAEKTEFGYWTKVDYECSCMNTRRNIKRMERSGLKNIINKYRFDTYIATEPWQEDVKAKAQNFVKERLENKQADDWFFVSGQSGSGKTHICTAICRELLLKGLSVKYMVWRDDSMRLKMHTRDYDEYEKLMGEIKNVDVLYIDDFFKCGYREDGLQKPTAADVNLAFEILNYRYNNPQLITIISSETLIDDLMDIDEAIAGRVLDKAKKYCIGFRGKEKNYRLAKTEE